MKSIIINPRIDELLRQGRAEEALREPLSLPRPNGGWIKPWLNGRSKVEAPLAEDLAFSGLVLGEVLYDYIRINPEVVHAVEFSRSADVDSVLSFARFADTKADLSGASLDGLHSELQGYVAEQLAAEHLESQGHDIVFPDSANNPGWDISVDGHPFQIKCLADPSGVYEHFQRYPDIPIIVNADLANQLGDHPGVYIDPQLHHDAVQSMTISTLDHGRNMAELDIPWISVLVSGASNIVYMVRNGTDVRAMLTCTATDALGRTVVAIPGKVVGAGLGALVFGPAGAIVVGIVGAVAGSMVGRRVAAAGRELFLFEESDAVRRAARGVAEEALNAMPAKLEAWDRKAITLKSCFSSDQPNSVQIQSVMVKRIEEQIEYWKAKRRDLEAAAKGQADAPSSLTERILTLVRRAGIHPHHVQTSLTTLADRMKAYLDECRRFKVLHP